LPFLSAKEIAAFKRVDLVLALEGMKWQFSLDFLQDGKLGSVSLR
jgi:hypothetical protein